MGERPRYRTFVMDSGRWDGFELRTDDIVISTPPKSGTTWMQMLCALLLFRTADLPAPLATLSPWLDMNTLPIDEVRARLDAQEHRRFIKTHTPLDGLPRRDGVTYLFVGRDPRDVAVSWDNHTQNLDMGRMFETRMAAVGLDDLEELGIAGPPEPPPEDPAERFWQWMRAEGRFNHAGGLPGLVHHAATFWEHRDEPDIHLFHYGDLRADLPGQMERLAEVLEVAPPTPELVEAGTFERMRARADELVPNSDIALWRDNTRFFDRARSGGWAPLLGDGGDERYAELLADLAPPDLGSWLHEGWLGWDGTDEEGTDGLAQGSS